MLTPEHLAGLLDLARALSGASDHVEIAKIAAERARVLTGASATQLSGLSQGGGIRSRASENDLVRSGGPIWIRSRRDASERYPDLVAATLGPDGAAWAVLPLVTDDEMSGVLTIVFDEEQPFDATTRAYLGEIATACGSALARGRLFTRARERASASEEARVAGEVR
jgi:GAF domain-containing protein